MNLRAASAMDPASLFSLAGRTALVTGGSRGLGLIMAKGLACAGARVYVCARHRATVEQAALDLSEFGTTTAIVADISTAEGIEAIRTKLEGVPLDILVNNAGITVARPLGEFTRDEFDAVLGVNLTAAFVLTQALLPLLRQTATPERPAHVVNIASVSGLRPSHSDNFAYNASKAGLIMLTRHLAVRLAREDVRVNAIAPGFFPTEMNAHLLTPDTIDDSLRKIPLGRVGLPEELAGALVFLCSRAGGYMTGAVLPVTGGMVTASAN